MTKEVYIFSGLGVDERVFQRIDFSGFSTNYIKWIVPGTNETIESYASKLISQITTPKPTLIGLSFGGIMAIEVAKQIDTEKLVLISSSKTRQELPWYYRLSGQIGLHKLLPIAILKNSNFITNWLFGVKSNFDKQLLKQILIDTDPIFLTWAIDQIVRWTNQAQIENTFHIHGTSDKILPLRFVECDVSIKNGGHLMILNRSEELTNLIREQL
jgi:pimeloyl-ACP methyl ester carboxylesterase